MINLFLSNSFFLSEWPFIAFQYRTWFTEMRIFLSTSVNNSLSVSIVLSYYKRAHDILYLLGFLIKLFFCCCLVFVCIMLGSIALRIVLSTKETQTNRKSMNRQQIHNITEKSLIQDLSSASNTLLYSSYIYLKNTLIQTAVSARVSKLM